MRGEDDESRKVVIRTEADIAEALAALTAADERLVRIAETAGPVPLRRVRSGLKGLLAIVVAQQVSKASADAIFGRLDAAVDLADPHAILAAGETTLRAAGLSRPKQQTVEAVAAAIAQGRLDLARLETTDAPEAIAELVAVRGIGPWTAECWLLFCTGHPDVFPAGDLALQVAVAHALDHESRPTTKRLGAIAEAWRPHRSVAARLFWAYYAVIHRRDVVPAQEAARAATPLQQNAKADRKPSRSGQNSPKPLS
ncbi:DNA-3-methyladenine glycosylase family protein [Jiella avicenniae]|uniref:DNA-3-methyladenine glycosylase II n=1 Tax=Jiella avicenniae TaxID=2907202 RepID=A0A9X1P3B3_9HYPH|nr:DNA-3-methyladenine glycosylase 2 family protein [Jiella avicenniae]MCE7028506.1 DNA-3-methyladenine glycosylase 2 family protein [Jiella avicenniae]